MGDDSRQELLLCSIYKFANIPTTANFKLQLRKPICGGALGSGMADSTSRYLSPRVSLPALTDSLLTDHFLGLT